MGRLNVNLCGIELDNPIIPASGTFGFGYEFAELYDINMLGTFSFKGTTKEPRFGNPTPRIAECSSGMLNAVGLQNPGVDKVISEELPKLKKCFYKKVMANVSGFSVGDYVYTVKKLDNEDMIGWFEIGRTRYKSRKRSNKQADYHKAFAERHGYSIDCKSVRECGRGRYQPYKYVTGHAY